jgi:hypothetical protein
MRSAGRMPTIGSAALASLLIFLACGAAIASDVERQIPLIRDRAGSGLTLEISREGARQTATPFLTLSDPTARRFEDRIAKAIVRLAEQAVPAGEAVADSIPRLAPAGTPREDTGRPQTSLASLPPLPGEITIRNVRNFLKGLRASRKESPVPAGAAAVPEQRIGMADTASRGAN